MKLLTALLTCLALIVSASAQDSTAKSLLSFEYEAECGTPRAEGQIFEYREGKVTKLTDGNALVFEQQTLNGDDETATHIIHLAGIDSQSDDSALAEFLSKKIVGREATVAGNIGVANTKFFGSVFVAGVGDVNRYILKNRIAGFSEPEQLNISKYSLCVYRQTVKDSTSGEPKAKRPR